jgi:nitrate reductase alpha subunit
LGNGGKGIGWNTEQEVAALATLNYTVLEEGVAKGRPRIETDIDAAEMIMMLAPETNGHVAVKAWKALVQATGRDHTHLAESRRNTKKSASVIFRRNRARLFLRPPGQGWRTKM